MSGVGLMSLMPAIAALMSGANPRDVAKSAGLEVQSLKTESLSDFDFCKALAESIIDRGSDVLFIHGSPAMLKGKKVRILAVIGDLPAELALPQETS